MTLKLYYVRVIFQTKEAAIAFVNTAKSSLADGDGSASERVCCRAGGATSFSALNRQAVAEDGSS